MVKKLIVFLFVAGMGIGSLSAQLAKTCFTNMPDSLSPLLTAVNRADFIDFLESKMKAEVTNRFGGKSEMTELTPDYIRVQVTPQSTWQMKLLSVNDSTRLICTVSTVCAPACDSYIKFYINLKNAGNNYLDTVVDVLVGDNILGRDIDVNFVFENDDLKIVIGDDAIRQALDTILSSQKGAIPEFKDYGIANEFIGTTVNAIQYPSIFKDVMNMFQRDSRWDSVELMDVKREEEAGIFYVELLL